MLILTSPLITMSLIITHFLRYLNVLVCLNNKTCINVLLCRKTRKIWHAKAIMQKVILGIFPSAEIEQHYITCLTSLLQKQWSEIVHALLKKKEKRQQSRRKTSSSPESKPTSDCWCTASARKTTKLTNTIIFLATTLNLDAFFLRFIRVFLKQCIVIAHQKMFVFV